MAENDYKQYWGKRKQYFEIRYQFAGTFSALKGKVRFSNAKDAEESFDTTIKSGIDSGELHHAELLTCKRSKGRMRCLLWDSMDSKKR